MHQRVPLEPRRWKIDNTTENDHITIKFTAADGAVSLALKQNEKSLAKVDIPIGGVGLIFALALEEAIRATKATGIEKHHPAPKSDQDSMNVPYFMPTRLELKAESGCGALVMHAGGAKFGILLRDVDIRSLGRALLTLSGDEAAPQ